MVSEVKKYIQRKKSVSMTELTLEFNTDIESLEMPINVLIERGYIKAELPVPDLSTSKCKGCVMGCKPMEQEDCSPTPSFTIYSWIGN